MRLHKSLFLLTLFALPNPARTELLPHQAKTPPAESYACHQYVNCMPPLTKGAEKYCRESYLEWAEANCGFTPQLLF